MPESISARLTGQSERALLNLARQRIYIYASCGWTLGQCCLSDRSQRPFALHVGRDSFLGELTFHRDNVRI